MLQGSVVERKYYPSKKYLKGLEIIIISNYFGFLKDETKLITVTCGEEDCDAQMCYYSKTGRPRDDRIRIFCEEHGESS